MERSSMIKKLEKEKNKKSSLAKSIATAVTIPLIIGSGVVLGINKYLEKQKQEVVSAFAGNCGYKTVNLYNYGHFKGQPYGIAREQFEQLRKKHTERFEKISNDEGTSWLMNHYNIETQEFKIPRYDYK